MRYAYLDLGEQSAGTAVVVRWSGARADVMLLDPVNFAKYRERRQLVLRGDGGRYARSPARMTIPEDGHWYVVADLRGHATFAEAVVEVHEPDSEAETPDQHAFTAAS